MLSSAEMFCGIGMSALGQVYAGLDLVDAIDLNKQTVRAFNGNSHLLPPVARVGYVGSPLVVEKIDVLCGGPVCRTFSPGARLFGTKGSEDERNILALCCSVGNPRVERLSVLRFASQT